MNGVEKDLTLASDRVLQSCQRIGSVAADLRARSRHLVTGKFALAVAVLVGVVVERDSRRGQSQLRIPFTIGRFLLDALSFVAAWRAYRASVSRDGIAGTTDKFD